MPVNKSLVELWFTNVNFMVCYSILTIVTLYLLRRKNKFILGLFTVLSVISLSLLFDAVDEIFYEITLSVILSHIIVLSPFYIYTYLLHKFHILSWKTILFLFYGASVEIFALMSKINITDILRYNWLCVFVSILTIDKVIIKK